MGCFIVPATVALGAEAFVRFFKHDAETPSLAVTRAHRLAKISGAVTAALVVEHAVNGEITTAWPFLTALSDASSRLALTHEIMTEGVAYGVGAILLWLLTWAFEKKRLPAAQAT